MNWVSVAAFDVQGSPKGQPRVKRSRSGGVFTPPIAKEWKEAVILAASKFLPPKALDCPLRTTIVFFFPRPQRLMSKNSPAGNIPHTTKPDKDNLEKTVLDALTEAGMWRDDSIVFSGIVEKYYAAKMQRPGAVIQVFKMEV